MTNKRVQKILERRKQGRKSQLPRRNLSFDSAVLHRTSDSSNSADSATGYDSDNPHPAAGIVAPFKDRRLSFARSQSSRESFRASKRNLINPDFDFVESSHERQKKDKIKQALPSTSLQFERVGLCGRNEEIKKLRSCLSRVVDASSKDNSTNNEPTSQNELILLGGESGSGKSSLAFQLQEPVERLYKGIFGTGKHEQSKKDVSMLGLFGATTQICQKVLALQETNPSLLNKIQNEMRVLIGEAGLGLLSTVIGEIPKILKAGNDNLQENGTAPKRKRLSMEKRMSLGKTQNQKVEIAFCILFRILCSHLSPIVMMVDDLQWCSDLSIFKILLNDYEISGLIIIGCYRSNEVEPDGPVSTFVQEFRSQLHPNVSFTEIDVGNLSLENTELWLSELLSKDRNEVEELASLCHSRTQGNVFFMKSFLSLLVEDGMMKFHVGSFTWDWNIQTIKEETSVAPNLVEVIQNRMAKLHHRANELMTIASCLGTFFDRDTLWMVWKKSHTSKEELADPKMFDTILDIVVQANCLEKAMEEESSEPGKGSCLYHFSHDKIQEAAISSIPLEDYQSLQHTVGTMLLQEARPSENDPMYYLITDLLNVKAQENVELAEMNLKAALAAKSIAAFTCAAKYVRYGIRCLPEDMWECQLELAVKLHSLGAVAELNLGNEDAAEQFCMAVIGQEKATPLQKCTAYHVKVMLCQRASKFEESLELCLDYLAELGCKFSRNKVVRKVQAAAYLEETRAKYIPTPEEIHDMPVMTEPIKVESRFLLEEAGTLAYMRKDVDLYIMIRCRYVRWIKKYGLTDDAATAFSSFAHVLMHVHGDFDTARSLAGLSLALQDMADDKYGEARTLNSLHSHVFGWVQPLHSQLQHLLAGYRSGMKSGNTFSGCACLAEYLLASFVSGSKLSLLEEDLSNFMAVLERRSMFMLLDAVRPVGQIVENLLGKSNETTLITGSIMDEKDFQKSFRTPSLSFFLVHKCVACAHFGDFETGAEIALNLGPDAMRKNFPGFGFGYEYLSFGLCLFATHHKTKQSKFKRPALQIREQLKKLVGKGCVNLVHHLSLLDAENYALMKKTDNARDAYSRAATEAARGGFLQDAGLANERYARHLLELGDFADASYRMKEAVKCYGEWGATKKVELLLEEHKELLSSQ